MEQAAHFYGIPLNQGKCDVNKDFYKGDLMFVADIPDNDGEEETTCHATLGLDGAMMKFDD